MPAVILPGFWLFLFALISISEISQIPPVISQEESNWRMTRFGWEQTNNWARPTSPLIERRIELVHPVIFSVLIVLLSVAFLIWATEEYDWDRLTKKRELTVREKLEGLERLDDLDPG